MQTLQPLYDQGPSGSGLVSQIQLRDLICKSALTKGFNSRLVYEYLISPIMLNLAGDKISDTLPGICPLSYQNCWILIAMFSISTISTSCKLHCQTTLTRSTYDV